MRLHPSVPETCSEWAENVQLHIAVPYVNCERWERRRRLMENFRRQIKACPNVVLHVGELAYGERPFEVTGDDVSDVQLQTSTELWHKENLINAIVRTFPSTWKYGGYIDADLVMTRYDWALEAIQRLQDHPFVQLFGSYTDLSSKQRPYRETPSFAWSYSQYGADLFASPPKNGIQTRSNSAPPTGAPGLAWAFRRDAFDAVGCLLDNCIIGGGDSVMAYGLVGKLSAAAIAKRCTPSHLETMLHWQALAAKLGGSIGYIENHAVHQFHGSKSRRAYGERWQILRKHNFDPTKDIVRDWQGIWAWAGNKPDLRDDLRRYFQERSEDDPNLYGAEEHIV